MKKDALAKKERWEMLKKFEGYARHLLGTIHHTEEPIFVHEPQKHRRGCWSADVGCGDWLLDMFYDGKDKEMRVHAYRWSGIYFLDESGKVTWKYIIVDERMIDNGKTGS